YEVVGKFRGDDEGWFQAEMQIADAATPLMVQRYLAGEEGIRTELNSWAAWLETVEHNLHHDWLMRHMVGTMQLFTIDGPTDAESVRPVEYLCLELCQFLARATAGVYQVDHQGFFAADGTLLVREE